MDLLGRGLVLFLILAGCVVTMVYLWNGIIRQTEENIRNANHLTMVKQEEDVAPETAELIIKTMKIMQDKIKLLELKGK